MGRSCDLLSSAVLNFSKEVIRFENTLTHWLVWLFLTCVKQLVSVSLKVCHLIITMFAQAVSTRPFCNCE